MIVASNNALLYQWENADYLSFSHRSLISSIRRCARCTKMTSGILAGAVLEWEGLLARATRTYATTFIYDSSDRRGVGGIMRDKEVHPYGELHEYEPDLFACRES